jgi:hypothetical protein
MARRVAAQEDGAESFADPAPKTNQDEATQQAYWLSSALMNC